MIFNKFWRASNLIYNDMSYKDEILYKYYLCYISSRNMSDGAEQLFKISKPAYDEFKERCNKDEKYFNKIQELYKFITREDKLNQLGINEELIKNDIKF